MNPPGETSGCQRKIKLIGLSLLSEISARQALSPRVPLAYYLPAVDNCVAYFCLAVHVSVTTIYSLSEISSVFQQEKYVEQIV